MCGIEEYRRKLEQQKGKQQKLVDRAKKLNENIGTTETKIQYIEQAQSLIQVVAQETQNQLKFHISDIVTMALESILDDPYKFNVDFVLKRNKTEAELYLLSESNKVNPMTSSGGGVVDIASFALRLALWSLGQTHNVLWFDEPFRYVSKEYQAKTGELLSKLSQQLGLQIIMVTHNQSLVDNSDAVYIIEKQDKTSQGKRMV